MTLLRLTAFLLTLTAAAACHGATDPHPPFDGKLKPAGDGRLDALMIPPFACSHASFIERGGDENSKVMAWFSGTKEGQSDVAIVVSCLQQTADGLGQWTKATVVSQRKGYSNQNPVLLRDDFSSNKTKSSPVLHLFHSQQQAASGESHANVWHLDNPAAAAGAVCSAAAQKAWTTPTDLFGDQLGGSFDRNRIVVGLDGSWIMPMYKQAKTNFATIETLSPGADPKGHKNWHYQAFPGGGDRVQPSIVRLKPGKPDLRVFFRDREAKHIYTATSNADGKKGSWTKAKAGKLPNNNSGIQARTLKSGRVAIVYNPQTNSRDPIAISLSEDGGKTWKYTRVLEHEDGHQEFSYPTLIQNADDGKIHVTYTWKRLTIKHSIIDESWIMGGNVTASAL